MGAPRVDLQHLLEELRDLYTGSLEETILTEITANALDSGATRIDLVPSTTDRTLTVLADGRGMTRRELARHHRIATGSRARREGIGCLGTALKLGLLVAEEVMTETRRAATHVATTWRLATRHRAPWHWIPPAGLLVEGGTAVTLRLSNPLSPLLDTGYLEEALRTHFAVLLDPAFADLLRRPYPASVTLDVSGQPVTPARPLLRDRVTIPIRMGRKRLPSAIAVLRTHDHPLPEDQQGIAISTRGKVIRRGWDWLGLAPASAWRVTGLVEAPELAACLTSERNDFVRSGPRGAAYLAYRRAIRDVVARQLAAWGDTSEPERRKTTRLEREVARVLEQLAETTFPVLRSLGHPAPEGQERLPLPGRDDRQAANALAGNLYGGSDDSASATPGLAGRRSAGCGLFVQFESRPGDPEPGRLVDRTIWINDAHPAYLRAAASPAREYHVAVSVALALAPHADASQEYAFVTQFLARWGAGSVQRPRRRR